MTFSATLFAAGIILLVLGLVGKMTIYEMHASTTNRILRIFFTIAGASCIWGGFEVEGVFRDRDKIKAGIPQSLRAETVPDAGKERHKEPSVAEEEPEVEKQPAPAVPRQESGREVAPTPMKTMAPPEPPPPPVVEKPVDQFSLKAVIDDPDGYTNLRSMPSTTGQIIRRIQEREFFYTYFQKAAWWTVRTSDGKYGYIHRSRIRTVGK